MSPPAPESSDAPADRALVYFAKTGVEVEARPGEILLEVAERTGVPIPAVCRGGSCGTCRVRLRRGRPEIETLKALSEKERRAGWILACSARAVPGRLVIDA